MNPAPDKDMTGTGPASGLSLCEIERQVAVLPDTKKPGNPWLADRCRERDYPGLLDFISILKYNTGEQLR